MTVAIPLSEKNFMWKRNMLRLRSRVAHDDGMNGFDSVADLPGMAMTQQPPNLARCDLDRSNVSRSWT